MRRLAFASAAALVACLAGGAAPLAAAGLDEWFRTPAQRAAAAFESGEHETLIERAPDARWEALGRYAGGDHAGAAEAFGRALDEEGGEAARNALQFGQATAETRNGRYAEALSLYEDILSRDPDDADARHNRDIARALQELEERQQRSEGTEGGEGEEDGSDAEGDSSGESGGGDSPSGERSPASSTEREAGAASDREAGSGSAPDEADEADERGEASAAEAAREALAAEARRADDEAGDRVGAEGDEAPREARAADTPSEREQATEQWLRRIEDDPAGLLRRRLERNHRDDYPEVRDGEQSW